MTQYLILAAALFSVGAFGVIARRNLLVMLMSLELMLNGANVALVAFARLHSGDAPVAHIFVLLVMAVAAAEVAVGLAILISLFRTRQTVDSEDVKALKG